MAKRFHKATSNIFLVVFIGLIIISFMFTGFETFRGTPDTVAKVGGKAIKFREFQRELSGQLAMYRRFFGDKDLTPEQIKRFRIKENTISSMINKHLWVKAAYDMGVEISEKNIIDEIKKQKYFLTNKRFDFERYKAILRAEGITSQNYENLIADALRGQHAQSMSSHYPISKKYLEDVNKFKNQKVGAHLVNVDKKVLARQISVSKKEVDTFLSKENNLSRAKGIFETRKVSLNKPERAKVHHILFPFTSDRKSEAKRKADKAANRLTVNNFARLAKKYSKKDNKKGGYLGWIRRGSMSRAVDDVIFTIQTMTISKPIKSNRGYHIFYVEKRQKAVEANFDRYKTKIARELIQVSPDKVAELESIVKKYTGIFQKVLKQGDTKKVKSLGKKYGLTVVTDTEVNRYNGAKGAISIPADQIKKLFSPSSSNNFIFNTITGNILVKTFKYREKKQSNKRSKELLEQSKAERKNLETSLGQKLSNSILADIRKNVKIKIYNQFLN